MYKERGETPLEAINRLRRSFPEYKDEVMTYAGRLDPMADGLLLILVGEECKNKEEYLGLEKGYVFEVLFGIETDTYDILGLIVDDKNRVISKDELEKALNKFTGKIIQEYPPFSSKPVNGKPLFMWAKESKLDEIEIPKREVDVQDLKLESTRFIKGIALKEYILDSISKVSGDDFRQKETIEGWQKFLDNKKDEEYFVAKIRMKCSSGTYVRTMVHILGKYLGVSTVTLNITRTQIGEYSADLLSD